MSKPPILEYHVRSEIPWRRLLLVAILVAGTLGGSFLGWKLYLQPRWQQAIRYRKARREFAAILNHRPDGSRPVAVIVDQPLAKTDPTIFDRFRFLSGFWERSENLGSDERGPRVVVERTFAPDVWYHRQVQYSFLFGTNLFVGKRTSADGKQWLVALDATIVGHVLYFHATTVDLRTPSLLERTFSLPVNGRPVKPFDYESKGKVCAEFYPLFGFPDSFCYLFAGRRVPNDPSAFTFRINYGAGRESVKESVKVRVKPDGTLEMKVPKNPSSSWQMHPR